jgi:hypothetical protein
MEVVKHWLTEIDLAKKRDQDFRKEGQRILDIYAGKKVKETPFNILFSNTETLLPATYSQVPRPVVQRRFKDEDTIGKFAAQAGTRVLEFLLDTNVEGYETFDDAMRRATMDALLPGRGVTQIKYDAKTVEAESMSYKESELVCADSKEWNRVYFGYAKKWSKCPWVAFEMHIDKDEAKRLFKGMASKLTFTEGEQVKDDDEGKNDENNTGKQKTALVYQIWDKDGGKKIRYISPQYKDGYLLEEDDPLQLTGFYNIPRPLQFVEKNDLIPIALYCLYENQAKELNDITRRINLLIRAIKAKAIYAGGLGDDIKKLVEADDNELVPAENEAALAAEKGLQNAIWFWPVDQLIIVLRELLGAREQCKQVIYEITGISDILRGSTVASETATAQKIKSQWGSLRLKRLQKEVQRYSREMLRLMLEIAASKFSEETWAKMTGLPFVTTEKHQAAQASAQMQQMTMGQVDPQTQATLAAPVWGQVLKVLRDDMQRAYRIDIETNSTVEAEATEDKEQMAEVMAAIGQALNGLTPLVTAGTLPFEAAQAMLLTIVRRFRFGPEVEDMIRAMKQPAPPEQAKQQMEQMKQQMEQQMQQIQQQAEQAVNEAKGQATAAQTELQKSNYEKDVLKRETALELKQIKLDAEQAQFELEKKYTERMISERSQTENMKLDTKKQVSALENGKFKTESVVDKKVADVGRNLQGTVDKLVQAQQQIAEVVVQQSQEIAEVKKLASAKRIRKAIRGKDGRIERTEEELAA